MAGYIYNWYEHGSLDRDVTRFDLELLMEAMRRRYSGDVNGSRSWREYWTPNNNRVRNDLWRPDFDEANEKFSSMDFEGKTRQSRCVFISHKREDKTLALNVAQCAINRDIDVWLDVLDPWLNAVSQNLVESELKSRCMAAIIEMGLINSSHILAIMTKNTRKSRWVPYEYGRVKINTGYSRQAASWNIDEGDLPEYQLLGPVLKTKIEVNSWLDLI